MDQWLVRTKDNHISRPISKDEIKVMVENGEIDLQDELCGPNGYWFFLHEAEEVKRFLGMDLPKSLMQGDDEDSTETNIVETLHADFEDAPEITAVISKNKKTPPVEPSRQATRPPIHIPKSNPIPMVQGESLEKPSVWKAVVLTLIGVIALLVAIVFRLLEQSS